MIQNDLAGQHSNNQLYTATFSYNNISHGDMDISYPSRDSTQSFFSRFLSLSIDTSLCVSYLQGPTPDTAQRPDIYLTDCDIPISLSLSGLAGQYHSTSNTNTVKLDNIVKHASLFTSNVNPKHSPGI